jgi:hypothetical protein
MTLDPSKGGAVLTSEPVTLGTGEMLAEKAFQFGLCRNSDAVVPLVG